MRRLKRSPNFNLPWLLIQIHLTFFHQQRHCLWPWNLLNVSFVVPSASASAQLFPLEHPGYFYSILKVFQIISIAQKPKFQAQDWKMFFKRCSKFFLSWNIIKYQNSVNCRFILVSCKDYSRFWERTIFKIENRCTCKCNSGDSPDSSFLLKLNNCKYWLRINILETYRKPFVPLATLGATKLKLAPSALNWK